MKTLQLPAKIAIGGTISLTMMIGGAMLLRQSPTPTPSPEPTPTPLPRRQGRFPVAVAGDKFLIGAQVYTVPQGLQVTIDDPVVADNLGAHLCVTRSGVKGAPGLNDGQPVNMPCLVDFPHGDGMALRLHFWPCKRRIPIDDPKRASDHDWIDELGCEEAREMYQ